MPWYNVVKTINGRKYLYRQRTYRAGGKVRTESQYIGAVDETEQDKFLKITSLDKQTTQSLHIVDRTPPEPVPPPSLRIQKSVRQREDLSIHALYREEEKVAEWMRSEGLNTTSLLPVRVHQRSAIGRIARSDGYYVYATLKGKRTLFKREFRKALATRWVDALQEQDPDRYGQLCDLLGEFHHWTMSGIKPAWLSFLCDLWYRRRRGHHVAIEMAAEAIQHGAEATHQKYFKSAVEADRQAERAWHRFRKLKQRAARKRQFAKCKKLSAKADLLSKKHQQAMWVRIYLFGERLPFPGAGASKPKQARRMSRKAKD